MSFPALLEAGRDPVFVQRGAVASVYLRLVAELDFVEFRRVRASDLANDMHLRPNTVGDALRILRDRGYIERGDRLLDVFTYRLLHSRRREIAPNR